MVRMGDGDQLDEPFILAKFLEDFRMMPTNKSLGINGLTMEFYGIFWNILSLYLAMYRAESIGSCAVKAISQHLGSVLVDVIYPIQTYIIPDQTIFDNLSPVQYILLLACRDSLFLTLLSLDQKKVV
ncbi:unnamed protein product [Caretta caretta]